MIVEATAPESLAQSVITRIEQAVLAAARHGITARRFLDFEGPLGAGITSIEFGPAIEHEIVSGPTPARVVGERSIPVPMLYAKFRIPVRELLGLRDQGLPFNTRPAEDAAHSLAVAEERLIYHGDERLGLAGLANGPGVQRVTIGDWSTPGRAIQDVIAAADRLDSARAREPFALVLAPQLFNTLVRKYEGSDVIQIDHVRKLAAAGVYKSLVLEREAVLVSRDVGPLVCTQDLETKFLVPADAALIFEVSEAIVLRFDDPTAVCVLAAGPA
jgi:uncharacterized linocin/CFP29 family protein